MDFRRIGTSGYSMPKAPFIPQAVAADYLEAELVVETDQSIAGCSASVISSQVEITPFAIREQMKRLVASFLSGQEGMNVFQFETTICGLLEACTDALLEPAYKSFRLEFAQFFLNAIPADHFITISQKVIESVNRILAQEESHDQEWSYVLVQLFVKSSDPEDILRRVFSEDELTLWKKISTLDELHEFGKTHPLKREIAYRLKLSSLLLHYLFPFSKYYQLHIQEDLPFGDLDLIVQAIVRANPENIAKVLQRTVFLSESVDEKSYFLSLFLDLFKKEERRISAYFRRLDFQRRVLVLSQTILYLFEAIRQSKAQNIPKESKGHLIASCVEALSYLFFWLAQQERNNSFRVDAVQYAVSLFRELRVNVQDFTCLIPVLIQWQNIVKFLGLSASNSVDEDGKPNGKEVQDTLYQWFEAAFSYSLEEDLSGLEDPLNDAPVKPRKK